MPKKLIEHTYGTHIYMKLKLDCGTIEEIDAYVRETGCAYRTTADHDPARREEVIRAFHELY